MGHIFAASFNQVKADEDCPKCKVDKLTSAIVQALALIERRPETARKILADALAALEANGGAS
jgi:hypothetical protein